MKATAAGLQGMQGRSEGDPIPVIPSGIQVVSTAQWPRAALYILSLEISPRLFMLLLDRKLACELLILGADNG